MIPNKPSQWSAKRLVILSILIGLTLAVAGVPGIAQSDDPTPVPASYYGTVTVDDEPRADLTVTAELNGTEYGSITTDESGEYGGPTAADQRLVVDPPEEPNDTEVTFFIEGENIDRTAVARTDPATVNWEAEDEKRVDLSYSTAAPDFQIRNLTAEKRVEQGKSTSISADVENIGGEEDTQDIQLQVDGSERDSRSVTLVGGERTRITFEDVSTDDLERGGYQYTVSSDDDSDNGELTVEGAAFSIDITNINESVVAGDNLIVTASITNDGEITGDVTAELRVGGSSSSVDDETLTINNGTSQAVTLNYTTKNPGDIGEFSTTVRIPGDSETEFVNVQQPATFNITEIDTNSPVTVNETVEATATIENVGDVAGSTDVNLNVSDTQKDSISIQSLEAGENVERTLNFTTAPEDVLFTDVSIETEDDDSETSVRVNASAEINTTDSSVAFADDQSEIIGGNATNYTITVVADSKSLVELPETDGTATVRLRSFNITGESGESFTIDYDANQDVSDGQLTLSTEINATAPRVSASQPVSVTSIQQNDTAIIDDSVEIGTIDVTRAGDRPVANITANRSNIFRGAAVNFTVKNASNGDPLPGATVNVGDSSKEIGADGNVSIQINVSGSLSATVTPQEDKYRTGENSSVDISVSPPALNVTRGPAAFGEVSTGDNETQLLFVENPTPDEISLDDPSIDGADADAFDTNGSDDDFPATIASGGNETLEVEFEPVEPGAKDAELAVRDQTVSLSGTGIQPVVNVTSSRPITATAENGSSVQTTVAVSNDGDDSLNASLSATGGNFSVDSTDLNISADGSDTATITFDAPDDPANPEIQSTLTINPANTEVENSSVALAGTVIERTVTIGSETVDVGTAGNVTVNTTGTSLVTVENDGTTTERLTATIEGDDNDIFGVVPDDQAFTLSPGGSELVTVNATPDTPGLTQATLNVSNTSDPTNVTDTATLNVTGQTPNLTVTTQSVDFGEITENSIATESVTVSNDGNASLNIEETSTSDPFTAPTPPSTIEVGETTTIPVQFTPESQYQDGVEETLVLNTTGGNATVELNGSTVDSDVSFDSDSRNRDFGSVGLEDTATETLTITNDGGGSFDVESIQIDADGFDVSDEPSEIDTSDTVEVGFDPDSTGRKAATVTVVEGDTGSANISASVSGTGRAAEFERNQQTLRTGVAVGGGQTTGSVGITNPAIDGTSLDITGLAFVNETDNFEITTDQDGLTIGGGEREDIAVEFTPDEGADDGSVPETLRVNYSTGDEETFVDIPVEGQISAPEPVVSPTTVSIDELPLDESRRQTIEISNDGGEPFEIDGIGGAEGITADQIGIDQVAPGGETLVVLTVDPDARDDEDSDIDEDITISAADTDVSVSDVTVTADVVAPELNVTTRPVDFGDTKVGGADQESVTIENTGNSTLKLDPPETTDPFSILSGKQEISVPAGGSETVTVAFEPESENDITGELTLSPQNDPDVEDKTVDLEGSGTPANPDVSLSQSTVDFDDVQVGDRATETVDIENTGEAESELVITGGSVIGDNADRFEIEFTQGRVLGENESESIDVTVNTTNTDPGSLSGLIQIQTNNGSETAAVAATAVEPEPTIEPATFETTRLGTTSTAEVDISNDGNAELDVDDVEITGADAAAFELDDTPENTLEPQETQRLDVVFDPGALADAERRARGDPLSANANVELQTVEDSVADPSTELTATADTAVVELDRTLAFGDTPIDDTRTRNLTIENNITATAPVKIETAEISGEDAAAYGATGGEDTLAPGESTDVEVSLTPDDLDRQFGTLTVRTNDTRQPVRKVGLSNSETTYRVDYGSVTVTYENPVDGQEPTADVDAGFEGRNATLTSASANVSTPTGSPDDYSLEYEYGTSPEETGETTGLDPLTLANTNTTDPNATDITSVQYLSADDKNTDISSETNESTFRIEVSKATIAQQNATNESVVINETNVDIYHENESGAGYEQPAEQELLFETTQGYVYEVTTDSYSVFAVGVSEPEQQSQQDEEEEEEEEETTDTTGGGGGGGIAGEENEQQDEKEQLSEEVEETLNEIEEQGPSVTEVREELDEAGPDRETTTEITDNDPDTPGVQVEPEGTERVQQISFDDEAATGNVDINEYDNPPESASESVTAAVAREAVAQDIIDEDVIEDIAADGDETGDTADEEIESSGDGDTADGGESTDSDTTTSQDVVDVVTVADITPDSEEVEGSSATVTMTVDRDEIDDPQNAFITKEQEDSWTTLETTVEERGDQEVILEAQTESFSLFAVTEVEETSEPAQESGDGDTDDSTDDGGPPVTLLIIGVLAVVAAAGAVLYARSN